MCIYRVKTTETWIIGYITEKLLGVALYVTLRGILVNERPPPHPMYGSLSPWRRLLWVRDPFSVTFSATFAACLLLLLSPFCAIPPSSKGHYGNKKRSRSVFHRLCVNLFVWHRLVTRSKNKSRKKETLRSMGSQRYRAWNETEKKRWYWKWYNCNWKS